MRTKEIAGSLMGQKVSLESTFTPNKLNELIENSVITYDGYVGNQLKSYGKIILVGNCSKDRSVEVFHCKRDNHVELSFVHDSKKLRGNCINHFSRFDLMGLKRKTLEAQYNVFLSRVVDRFCKVVALAIHYGELKENEFLWRSRPLSFGEKYNENFDLLQGVKVYACDLSLDLAMKDDESAEKRFGKLLSNVDELKRNVGMGA